MACGITVPGVDPLAAGLSGLQLSEVLLLGVRSLPSLSFCLSLRLHGLTAPQSPRSLRLRRR